VCVCVCVRLHTAHHSTSFKRSGAHTFSCSATKDVRCSSCLDHLGSVLSISSTLGGV
jgi:hypothetical protein